MIKKEERVEGPKEEKKEEGGKGSGIFPISRILKKPPQEEKKKEEDRVEEKKIVIEKDVKDLKDKIPAIDKKVDDHDKKIAALEKRADKVDDAIKHIYSELSKCLRFWILWVIAGLLGGVGVVYILNNFAFKPATVHSYFVGMIGGAIIATLFYLHYRSKINQQE